MSVIELLSRLRSLNIELWADDERLRFSAPAGTLTPELRTELKKHKAEILDFLRNTPTNQEETRSIPAVSHDQPLPLSFAQQRMWFFEQLEPGTSVYTMPAAIRLLGHLHIDAFEHSLNAIVHRHETLRTTFVTQNDQPIQIIAPHLTIPIVHIDLQAFDEQKREAETKRWITEESEKPFDLTSGPLLRATLLHINTDEYVLLLTMHHITADIWSIGIFIRELTAFYTASVLHLASIDLPSLPIQYADFAVWQRQWLQGSVLERRLAYWKRQLGGELPILELPTDYPRPAAQTFSGICQTLQLPGQLTTALEVLCRQESVTLFMTLLVTFKALLFRYSGQSDILVGSPIANRTHLELEGLIGFFANTLVLRTDLSGDPTFVQLLKRVREMTLEAYEQQDLPFEQLVEALQPVRDPSRSPLFQVMFVLQNAGLPTFKLPELTLSFEENEHEMSRFDLTLSATESEDGLLLGLVYNTDLFAASTIQDMLQQYQMLLETVTIQADIPLSALISTIPLKTLPIVVAATFTAEPLADTLALFMEQLNIPYRLKFAPYNQLFQQLLDQDSILSTNHEGITIMLVRLEDWVRMDKQTHSDFAPLLEQSVHDFIDALISFNETSTAPLLLYLCPPSDEKCSNPQMRTLLQNMEQKIIQSVGTLSGIALFHVDEIAARYDLEQINDVYADKLGRVPYTTECFAVIGTSIARYIFALQDRGYQAIFLDCDQTLWPGYAGEDAHAHIHMQPAYVAFQDFMVHQYTTGKLLCLCSHNDERDIVQVFRCQRDMPLKLLHFTSWRCDWQSTTEQIHILASELRLALEALIYVSSNPGTCAEVRATCPEVLTLQLPTNADAFLPFLNNVWAFDTRGDRLA